METSIFTKGINQDIAEKYQEDGTYRTALNAVLETSEGESPAISNELGNTTCSINFPSSKRIIGSALTDTDDTVLFLYDPEGEHEIGVLPPGTLVLRYMVMPTQHYPTLLDGDIFPLHSSTAML